MKAVVWHGTNDIRVERVPDPAILNPRDAIVRVTTTAICGSDLHLLDGFIPTMKAGDFVITHRLPIDQAPNAYKTFRDKQDSCIKVVLKPHAEAVQTIH